MKIAIVPEGNIDREVLDFLKEGLTRVFVEEVAVMDAFDAPLYALDKERGRYLATAILKDMKDRRYGGHGHLLAVVDRDLFAEGADFVFGLADGDVSVVSIKRLKESFYGLDDDRRLFLRRALTEAVHELGHTYGLKHCYDTGCAMFFSDSILETDRKGPSFCKACSKRLRQ